MNSPLLWTIVGMIISIPLLVVLALSYIRTVSPNSRARKMAAEQSQLDKKSGTTGGAPSAPADESDKRSKWFKSNLWSILVVIVGAVLVYWGFNTQARPADVGSWNQDHWLPLLIIWGILAALIALNATGTTAKT